MKGRYLNRTPEESRRLQAKLAEGLNDFPEQAEAYKAGFWAAVHSIAQSVAYQARGDAGLAAVCGAIDGSAFAQAAA